MRFRHAFPAFLLPLMAACASSDGDYPSLAIRDAERVGTAPPAETAPDTAPPAPIPEDLQQRVTALRAQATEADAAFQRKLGPTTRAVESARSAAIASKSWSSAQTALSDLDSHRSATAIVMADLDKLYAERALQLQRRDFIEEARIEIAAMLARQDESLSRLQSMIAP